MMYVAKVSFLDASDGSMIEKGRSRVSPEADVFKRFPERFELVRSSPGTETVITRPGPVMSFGKPSTGRRRPKQKARRKTPRTISSLRALPYWQLTEREREPWRLR
jgi:hypothetical protein